jgi:glycosyltransferase involved in cell wall biosynthesis
MIILDTAAPHVPVATPRISVVIATYNRAGSLREALEHLLRQAGPEFEVFIVDNGPSTDGTRAVALEAVRDDPRCFYLQGDAKGVAAARNAACERARGELILALDDDFYVTDPGTLEYIDRRFREEKDLGVLGIEHAYSGPAGNPARLRRWYYAAIRFWYRPGSANRWGRVATRTYYLPAGRSHDVAHVKSACMPLRRKPAEAFGFFPVLYTAQGLGYRSETELCCRMAAQGYRVALSSEVTGMHTAAQRPGRTQARERTEANISTWARNNALFTLRNFWTRRGAPVFYAFDLLVGNFNQPGLLRILASRRFFLQWSLIAASLRGKREGYRLYRERYYVLSDIGKSGP